MKIFVGIILLLNVWLWADTEIPYSAETISQFKGLRNSLLESLRNKKSDEVVSTIHYIKEMAPDEFAIDNLEMLQIYLLIERYDLAVDLWLGEYEKCGENVQYSFATDSLLKYLDANMNLEDSSVVKEVLEKSALSVVDKEQKSLYEILLKMRNFFEIRNKFNVMHIKAYDRPTGTYVDKLANRYEGVSLSDPVSGKLLLENRVRGWSHYYADETPECVAKLIASLKEFEQWFPHSKYLPWIKNEQKRFEELLEKYWKLRNYYKEKLYTGGIGVEGWYSNGNWEIGIPIQFWRFLFVPTVDLDDGNWIFIFGFDLFEMKHLKIVPFAGLWDPYVAGMQTEFRLWLEKYPDSKFGGAAYLSLKVRYMMKYGELENDGKKGLAHLFYAGIGFHFW